jgi:hypothetical protein
MVYSDSSEQLHRVTGYMELGISDNAKPLGGGHCYGEQGYLVDKNSPVGGERWGMRCWRTILKSSQSVLASKESLSFTSMPSVL